MLWFKHFNDASDGETLQNLWAQKDYRLIAFYWFILETVSKFEKEDRRGYCEVSLSYFKMKLNINSSTSTQLLLRIHSTFKIEVKQISSKSYSILVHNWLKIQENRGGKKRTKNDQSGDRCKMLDVRSKIVDVETTSTQNVEKKENKFFEKFVFEDLGSFDTGLAILAPKVETAFLTKEGFYSFVDSVMNSKKVKSMSIDERKRYFQAALKSELKDRGVL